MTISDFLNDIRKIESSPEEEMKQFVLALAREFNLDTGHVLPERVLMSRSFSLNPKQKDALVPAINNLISEGIFEEKDGSAFLTEKGRDILY